MKPIENFNRNNFDVARLIAASFVLISHAYELAGKLEAEPLYKLTGGKVRLSAIGLYVFFFISGYLVTNSFLTTGNTLKFIWKRFLRIYPALIIIVLITVFIAGPILTHLSSFAYFHDVNTFKYLLTATGFYIRVTLPGVFENSMHHNHGVNGSLWSIALELELYVTLILAGIFYKRGFKNIFLLLNIFTAFFLLFLYFNAFQLQQYFSDLHAGLFFVFWVGSLCCIYKEKLILNLLVLLILFAVFLITIYYFPVLQRIAEALFFGYLTLVCCYRTKPLHIKNDISYGVYIYAFLVTQIVIEFNPNLQIGWLIIIVIAITFPVAFLSWKLIESKALALKKYAAFFYEKK